MPLTNAAQMDTTQNILGDVLLHGGATGKKINSFWVLWMGGVLKVLIVLIFFFFCLSTFSLFRKYFLFDCFSRSISTSKECPASEFTQNRVFSALCGLVISCLCMWVTESCWIGLKQMSTLLKLEQQLEQELQAFWGEPPHLTPNGPTVWDAIQQGGETRGFVDTEIPIQILVLETTRVVLLGKLP